MRRKATRRIRRHAAFKVEDLLVGHDAADIPEQRGRVKVAAIVLIAVESRSDRETSEVPMGDAELQPLNGVSVPDFSTDTPTGVVLAEGLGVAGTAGCRAAIMPGGPSNSSVSGKASGSEKALQAGPARKFLYCP